MKKLILSILAVIFITVIIPLAIVELVPPRNNAASTEPQHEDAAALFLYAGNNFLQNFIPGISFADVIKYKIKKNHGGIS